MDPPAPVAIPPIIFQAPDSARADDVIAVYGYNFGASGELRLNGSPLATLKRASTYALAARIPADATGAFSITAHNGSAESAAVVVNRAQAFHLNCTEIHPSGAFRIFGRNLKLAGYTAAATVNGLNCTVDQDASHEHMLVCTAPAGITAGDATVAVNNGNGSATDPLEGDYTVSTTGAGDDQGIGVGWGAVFDGWSEAAIAGVVADDSTNNTTAIQNAINAASAGSILTLPSGTIRVASIQHKNGVILKGAGLGVTILKTSSNFGIDCNGKTDVGVRDMTVLPSTAGIQVAAFVNCTRVFLKNVRFEHTGVDQQYFQNNTDIALVDCEWEVSDALNNNGVLVLGGSRGGHISGNDITWGQSSAMSLQPVSDFYVAGNALHWDLAYQEDDGANKPHGFTFDFAHRLYFGGNSTDTVNGPATNFNRTDMEMYLAEAGGAGTRQERSGMVDSATATTLTDTGKSFPASTALNRLAYIIAGTGFGQVRRVTAIDGDTLTVAPAWDVDPDTTSRYVFAIASERITLRGNSVNGNKSSIWFWINPCYQVDIVDSDLQDTSGVYLRAELGYEDLITPLWKMRLAGNSIENALGEYPGSHLSIVVTRNPSATVPGTLFLGLEYRDETLTAFARPNDNKDYSTFHRDHATDEGLWSGIRYEAGSDADATLPAILLPIFQRCSPVDQDHEYRLGTGVVGGLVVDSSPANCGVIENETVSPYDVGAEYEVIA